MRRASLARRFRWWNWCPIHPPFPLFLQSIACIIGSYQCGYAYPFLRKVINVANLRSEEKGEILVVYFNDAKILDEAKIQQIGNELMEKVGEAPNAKLLLNFSNVTFMSSAMIGKVILLNKKSKGAKVNLKLCEISDNVMEVFKLMRLNKILDIQKSEEKALAAFDKKGLFR